MGEAVAVSLPGHVLVDSHRAERARRAIGEVTTPGGSSDAHQLFSDKQPEDRVGLPRLYLDVDGVLVEFYGNPRGLQLRAGAGSFMRFVADNFNVVWCTAWFDKANLLIPALAGFPVDEFSFPALVWSGDKAAAILAREGANLSWVWVDDECGSHEREKLKGALAFGNLVRATPSKPLTHVTWKLKRWLAGA